MEILDKIVDLMRAISNLIEIKFLPFLEVIVKFIAGIVISFLNFILNGLKWIIGQI